MNNFEETGIARSVWICAHNASDGKPISLNVMRIICVQDSKDGFGEIVSDNSLLVLRTKESREEIIERIVTGYNTKHNFREKAQLSEEDATFVTDRNVGTNVKREAAIEAVCDELDSIDHVPHWVFERLTKRLKELPPVKPEMPEKLTDTEQRIFLMAMKRERDICKVTDEKTGVGNLTKICDEIERKVKGALWN